jgi:ketosteroid isomerase-like protein
MSKGQMTKGLLLGWIFVLMLCTPALSGDPTEIASVLSARFDKAFAACDVPGVLALYEDGATAIYADVLSHGKPEIAGMVKTYCNDGHQKVPPYKQTAAHARLLCPDWIMMVRVLDGVDEKAKAFRINATELIHKSGGKWRYLVDHASFGAPPAKPAAGR